MIREPGVWNNKRWVGGDPHYTWLNDITITPTEVTVTLRDDATWSDGTLITGVDIAFNHMLLYLRNPFPAYFATEKKDTSTVFWDAIDAFDISEREVTYRSSPGYFEKYWDWSLRSIFGMAGGPAGLPVPTHMEPYNTFAEAVFETARRAIQGEINPWKGWDNRFTQPDDPHAKSLMQKYLAKEGKYVAKFSKPKHIVSNSIWNLVKLDGPEAVYEPNPHHRNAEHINFERVILEYTASKKRARAALKADRLDYANPGPTPKSVVTSLPNNITQMQIPGSGSDSGNELHLDFDHPALGKREVRLALMYALDQSAIANNIHQSTAIPVNTPGGDSWNATDYMSEEWIDENLTTYSQDHDKASSLMRAAGYTRDGSQWINPDSEPLTLQLPTPSRTPRWEPTVASQLTEFGIQTSVETLNEQVFTARRRSGDFSIWTDSGAATSTAAMTLLFWRDPPVAPKVYGIYPREQFQTGNFDVSAGGAPVPRTEERYDIFTIQAPAIGQPNGPLQEYHPSALAMAFFTNPPETEFRRRVKTAMWLANAFLPTIPINKTLEQHFIDNTHWQWPTKAPSWETYKSGGPRSINGIFASGMIRANPDNPEIEAK